MLEGSGLDLSLDFLVAGQFGAGLNDCSKGTLFKIALKLCMCAVKSQCVTPVSEEHVKIIDSHGNTELVGLGKTFKIIEPQP